MSAVIQKLIFGTLLGLATRALFVSANPFDGRIVGGWEISIDHFPHQVSLQFRNTHMCGACIIAPDIVLTAAHCVARYSNPNLYSIRAGSTYSNQGGVVIAVKAFRKHELYANNKNDLAVLKLAQPLIYSTKIQPIALLEENDQLKENEQCWVSGWGTENSQVPQMSPILRYTSVNKIPLEKCRQSYNLIADVDENMLCAGVLEGGRDSCQGDSGGPLIIRKGNSVKLVGIVSFGLSCALAKYPGVYMKVQNYHPWLNKTINELKTIV